MNASSTNTQCSVHIIISSVYTTMKDTMKSAAIQLNQRFLLKQIIVVVIPLRLTQLHSLARIFA